MGAAQGSVHSLLCYESFRGILPNPDNTGTTLTAMGPCSRFRESVLLCFHPQQVRGLGAEAEEFFILGLVLFHPWNCLVVPGARLRLVPELPVCHGQEERVEALVLASEQLH